MLQGPALHVASFFISQVAAIAAVWCVGTWQDHREAFGKQATNSAVPVDVRQGTEKQGTQDSQLKPSLNTVVQERTSMSVRMGPIQVSGTIVRPRGTKPSSSVLRRYTEAVRRPTIERTDARDRVPKRLRDSIRSNPEVRRPPSSPTIRKTTNLPVDTSTQSARSSPASSQCESLRPSEHEWIEMTGPSSVSSSIESWFPAGAWP